LTPSPLFLTCVTVPSKLSVNKAKAENDENKIIMNTNINDRFIHSSSSNRKAKLPFYRLLGF
jgi:hypothetical protein